MTCLPVSFWRSRIRYRYQPERLLANSSLVVWASCVIVPWKSCLHLLIAASVAWNTIYLTEAFATPPQAWNSSIEIDDQMSFECSVASCLIEM